MELPGRIDELDGLLAHYRRPSDRAVAKSFDAIDDGMAAFIERCPFLVLATADGQGSIDASPRGGPPGFVRLLDERHVAIPDLNGNNRLDSYRNVVRHGWAGVLMVVPGKDETLRINGPAALTNDQDLLDGFTAELRRPTMALVIETAEIYGHCAKAFRRGRVWDPTSWGQVADAPDLAEMYASSWEIDADDMREVLADTYRSDLAQD